MTTQNNVPEGTPSITVRGKNTIPLTEYQWFHMDDPGITAFTVNWKEKKFSFTNLNIDGKILRLPIFTPYREDKTAAENAINLVNQVRKVSDFIHTTLQDAIVRNCKTDWNDLWKSCKFVSTGKWHGEKIHFDTTTFMDEVNWKRDKKIIDKQEILDLFGIPLDAKNTENIASMRKDLTKYDNLPIGSDERFAGVLWEFIQSRLNDIKDKSAKDHPPQTYTKQSK